MDRPGHKLRMLEPRPYDWALRVMLSRLKKRKGLRQMDKLYAIKAEVLWDEMIEFYVSRPVSDPRALPRMANLATLMENEVHVV